MGAPGPFALPLIVRCQIGENAVAVLAGSQVARMAYPKLERLERASFRRSHSQDFHYRRASDPNCGQKSSSPWAELSWTGIPC